MSELRDAARQIVSSDDGTVLDIRVESGEHFQSSAGKTEMLNLMIIIKVKMPYNEGMGHLDRLIDITQKDMNHE